MDQQLSCYSPYFPNLKICLEGGITAQYFSFLSPFSTYLRVPWKQLLKSWFSYLWNSRCMISSSCFSPEQFTFRMLVLTSWNHISMGFSCGLQGGRNRICTPHLWAIRQVSSLSWMAQLSITSHFSRPYSSGRSCSFSNSSRMKSRYSYFRQVPSMMRQLARPSSSMIAIRLKRFPLEMGQLTVISSWGRDQALSLVMYRLKPDSSRKYILAFLSSRALQLTQNSYLLSRDLVVFFSLGTHLTLFFLNLPSLSSLATIVLLMSTLCPSLKLFRSSILLSSTHSSDCVMKGFSLTNLAMCSSLSTISFFSGVRLWKSYLMTLSQKVGSSSHSWYSLWIVRGPMANISAIQLSPTTCPLQSWLFSQAQQSSKRCATIQRVFFFKTLFFLENLLYASRLGSISNNCRFSSFSCLSFYMSSLLSLRISRLISSALKDMSVRVLLAPLSVVASSFPSVSCLSQSLGETANSPNSSLASSSMLSSESSDRSTALCWSNNFSLALFLSCLALS